MALEHEEISEQIIGAAFEVHGILGYGFLEKVYQRAMQVELKATGMSVGLLINFGKQKVEFKRFAYSGESAFHPRESAAKRNNAHQLLEVTLNSAPQFDVMLITELDELGFLSLSCFSQKLVDLRQL